MSLVEIAQTAPIGLVRLDARGKVVELNPAASALGISVGDAFCELVNHSMQEVMQLCIEQTSALAKLQPTGAVKQCRLTGFIAAQENYLWLEDLSAEQALAGQMQALKRPTNKKTRLIAQATNAGLGYAELLSVILDDNIGMAPEKQTLILRYHEEVTAALSSIHAIVTGDAQDAPKAAAKNVMVVEGDVHLAELISELLTSKGYSTDSFTDSQSAMRFYAINGHKVTIAVVDEALTCADGRTLVQALRDDYPKIRLLALTLGEAGDAKVRKPVIYDELLSRLQELLQAS
ncbi:MAG: hypothetical protein ACR2PJ_01015 [Pseudomonadales bacterium]